MNPQNFPSHRAKLHKAMSWASRRFIDEWRAVDGYVGYTNGMMAKVTEDATTIILSGPEPGTTPYALAKLEETLRLLEPWADAELRLGTTAYQIRRDWMPYRPVFFVHTLDDFTRVELTPWSYSSHKSKFSSVGVDNFKTELDTMFAKLTNHAP